MRLDPEDGHGADTAPAPGSSRLWSVASPPLTPGILPLSWAVHPRGCLVVMSHLHLSTCRLVFVLVPRYGFLSPWEPKGKEPGIPQ